MFNYQQELFARERIRTLIHEADQERLARRASASRPAGLPWRERLALALGRRFARFAPAS